MVHCCVTKWPLEVMESHGKFLGKMCGNPELYTGTVNVSFDTSPLSFTISYYGTGSRKWFPTGLLVWCWRLCCGPLVLGLCSGPVPVFLARVLATHLSLIFLTDSRLFMVLCLLSTASISWLLRVPLGGTSSLSDSSTVQQTFVLVTKLKQQKSKKVVLLNFYKLLFKSKVVLHWHLGDVMLGDTTFLIFAVSFVTKQVDITHRFKLLSFYIYICFIFYHVWE